MSDASDENSAFADAGPGAFLPVMETDDETYGGLQATKMDVAGTEILVYQDVDKSYLQECLEEPVRQTAPATATPVIVVGITDSEMNNDENDITPSPLPVVKPPPKKKTVPPKPSSNGLQCPICPKILPDDVSFAVHFQIHSNNKQKNVKKHACFMCDYTTVNKTMFQEHIYMHQGIKPYKCTHCKHRSGSKKNMKKHERRHFKRSCPTCGCLMQTQKTLEEHMETCRPKDKVIKPRAKDKIIEACDSLTMVCDKCKFTTTSKNLMEQHTCHIRRFREVGKEKFFECQICKWSSKNEMKVLLHLIHHPKQKVDEKVIDITILKEHGIMD